MRTNMDDKAYSRKYYREHTEKCKEYQRKYRAAHKEELKMYFKNDKDRRYKVVRKTRMKKKYGLSEEEYDKILEKQNGECVICKRSLSNIRKCIDHNHHTGKVRGILCGRCNLLLGHAKDNIDILSSAVTYLLDDPDMEWYIREDDI